MTCEIVNWNQINNSSNFVFFFLATVNFPKKLVQWEQLSQPNPAAQSSLLDSTSSPTPQKSLPRISIKQFQKHLMSTCVYSICNYCSMDAVWQEVFLLLVCSMVFLHLHLSLSEGRVFSFCSYCHQIVLGSHTAVFYSPSPLAVTIPSLPVMCICSCLFQLLKKRWLYVVNSILSAVTNLGV